ncbi:MAG: DNA replication complex GINS family protein [Candidatus Bathyarchaeia archaeon]|nr:DNA replication complex GINS family protein [Candidatus Bathyarchaeia archaeon]
MPKTIMNIRDLDFIFEHTPTRIIANRNCPEIKLAGLNVGPFDEGNEYEIQFWIAQELVKAGIARFREDERLDAAKLYKIQWTERVQTAGQIPKLPENFYPKLRRYLIELKEEASKNTEKIREYEKIKHLTQDVLNARLKKIVSLASAPAQIEQTLKNLTVEERILYDQLYNIMQKWRTQIMNYEKVEE